MWQLAGCAASLLLRCRAKEPLCLDLGCAAGMKLVSTGCDVLQPIAYCPTSHLFAASRLLCTAAYLFIHLSTSVLCR